MTAFFDDFQKISDHFPKISEDFPKLFRRPNERCRTFFENLRKFPKMSEDFRKLLKTFEEDPKMFRWCTNEFKYNLRDKLDITEVTDIFTCEDIISSHVRISYRFYQFVTSRYTTDFYVINEFYVRVARTISHEWTQRTSEILFLPREHKIHIFELTCKVLFII